VTLYYDLPGNPSDYIARKHNTTTKVITTISGASITRETYNNKSMIKLTYQITDGGVLDQDGQVNGTIVDPVGIGALFVGAPNTGYAKNFDTYIYVSLGLLGIGYYAYIRKQNLS
jgi:hypothetical protein